MKAQLLILLRGVQYFGDCDSLKHMLELNGTQPPNLGRLTLIYIVPSPCSHCYHNDKRAHLLVRVATHVSMTCMKLTHNLQATHMTHNVAELYHIAIQGIYSNWLLAEVFNILEFS